MAPLGINVAAEVNAGAEGIGLWTNSPHFQMGGINLSPKPTPSRDTLATLENGGYCRCVPWSRNFQNQISISSAIAIQANPK